MCRKAERAKVRTSVWFNSRAYATHLYMRELIESGFVGKPLFGESQYLTDRDLLIAEGDWRDDEKGGLGVGQSVIHMADTAIWLVGQIAEVSASNSIFRPLPQEYQEGIDPALGPFSQAREFLVRREVGIGPSSLR